MDFRTATTAMTLLFALGLALPSASPASAAGEQPTTEAADPVTTRDYTETVEERDEALVPASDADEDGYVTREEAAADWEQGFITYDRDQDQTLSDEEWVFDEGPAFEDLDADGDGTISQEEWAAGGEQSYEEALTEGGGEQITTRDYNERRAWRDESLVPPAE